MNNILNMFTQFTSMGNKPENFLNFILQKNPNTATMIRQFQNMANGKSPKDLAIQLAQQNGIGENQLMQMAKTFGIK